MPTVTVTISSHRHRFLIPESSSQNVPKRANSRAGLPCRQGFMRDRGPLPFRRSLSKLHIPEYAKSYAFTAGPSQTPLFHSNVHIVASTIIRAFLSPFPLASIPITLFPLTFQHCNDRSGLRHPSWSSHMLAHIQIAWRQHQAKIGQRASSTSCSGPGISCLSVNQ